MRFIEVFAAIYALQVQIWIDCKIISRDVHKIANVVLEFERVNERNHGQKLTAIPLLPWLKNRSPVSSNKLSRTTFTSLCAPWDSCENRCGKRHRGLPFTCSCDPFCHFYGDCCSDYERQCERGKTYTLLKSPIGSADCETHPDFNWPIYVIRSCSSNWSCSTCLDHQLSSPSDTGLNTDCRNGFLEACKNNDKTYCREYDLRNCTKIKEECEKNENATDLVISSMNYVFANPNCAVCNGEYSFVKVPTGFSEQNRVGKNRPLRNPTKPRACFSVEGKCSYQNSFNDNSSLDELCGSHGGPVVSSNAFYKNVYCAVCNEDESTLSCPTWLLNPAKLMSLENVHHGIISALITDDDLVGTHKTRFDLPAAFSILLNFGLDGQQRMIFSSESEENLRIHRERCGEDRMWDPFSEICRKIYCSAEFTLKDYRCIKRVENDQTEDDKKKQEDIESEFVHLSLSVEIDTLDVLHFYGTFMEPNITEIIADSLAKAFQVNVDRIQNVQLNITLGNSTNHNETIKFIDEMGDFDAITFSIDFDLYENPSDHNETEPTVETVVSMLTSQLTENKIELDIDTVKSKILNIHQTTGLLESWCNPLEGNTRREYWNTDFTLSFSDDNSTVTKLFVNSTQKTYRNGDFVVSILYQGYQLKKELMNISELAIVCDRISRLNESCMRVMLTKEEFNILPNGSLQLLNQTENFGIDTEIYEWIANDSVLVCYLPYDDPDLTHDYYLDFDVAQAMVSLVSLCLSVVALTLVLITYLVFPSLRNLPGYNTMNLTFSLLTMQITFLFGQRSGVVGIWCKIAAQLLHYEILCSFMWMNVMAYDLYKTFGSNTMVNTIRSKRKFIWRYMVYAYGTPLIIMTICFLLEIFSGDSPMSPHYGFRDACWIASKQAAILFFAGPLALIMAVNISLYVLIIKAITSIKHIAKLDAKNHCGKNDVRLYIRMAFVTGLTWALIFVAAYVPTDELLGQIITYCFIVANTLQGVYIFSVFVCNKRVYDLYKNSLTNVLTKHKNSSGILSWVSRTISRTISTDTAVSTISNLSASLSNSPE